MMTWLCLNSVGLALVSLVLYFTLRQIGFVLIRVGPPGARVSPQGPRVGEHVGEHLAQLAGMELQPGAAKARLLVFGADSCSICAPVKAAALDLARSWQRDADILIIYDCEPGAAPARVEKLGAGLYFTRDGELRRQLGVRSVPFAMMTDSSGVVLGKGLVNEIGHLESLLELAATEGREMGIEFAGNGVQA